MNAFYRGLCFAAIGALTFFGCQDQEGLNEGTIKLGGKLSISNGTCKTFTQSARKFFVDQVTGGEREVLAAELKQRMDDALPTAILDVRPLTEYSAAHIPGSLNVPLDVLFEQALCPDIKGCCNDDRVLATSDAPLAGPAAPPGSGATSEEPYRAADPVATGGSRPGTCKPPLLPTDGTPIVLVSSNGHAASMAAGVLGTMGYNVYVLRFGMISWASFSDVRIHRADRTQRIQGLGGPLEL